MSKLAYHLPTIILVLAIIPSLIIPFIDHHSADKQPGHRHLFEFYRHVHSVNHIHNKTSQVENTEHSYPTVYGYDSAIVSVGISMTEKLLDKLLSNSDNDNYFVLKSILDKPTTEPKYTRIYRPPKTISKLLI